MEDFFITLLCGLVGCAIAAYALHKAFKQFEKVDHFFEHVVKMPRIIKWWRESWLGFWIIAGTMFFTTIKIAQWIGEHLAGVQY